MNSANLSIEATRISRSDTSSVSFNGTSQSYPIARSSVQTKRKMSDDDHRRDDHRRQTAHKKMRGESPERVIYTKMIAWKECKRAERDAIFASVAHFVWKRIVFAPEGGELLVGIMKMVYEKMDPVPPPDLISKEGWLRSRINVVNTCFNVIRCNISVALKKTICKYVATHCGDNWPSLDKFRACAYRSLKLEYDPEASEEEKEECRTNMDLFVFYWDEVLRAACPQNTKFWCDKVRYKSTITDQDNISESAITVQMEAFALLVFENNWDYWRNWVCLQSNYKNKSLHRCPGAKLPKEENSKAYSDGHFVCSETGKVFFFGPKYKPKYSNANAGSNITGGWSDPGKRRFTEIVRKVREARANKNSLAVEKIVLTSVCERKLVGKGKMSNSVENMTQGWVGGPPTVDLTDILDAEMATQFLGNKFHRNSEGPGEFNAKPSCVNLAIDELSDDGCPLPKKMYSL